MLFWSFPGRSTPTQLPSTGLKRVEANCGPKGLPISFDFYEQHPNFPASLNGRFQGVLTDRKQGTSILFNDRYGMERIYYHEAKEGFYFAAEAKAILTVRPELRVVEPCGARRVRHLRVRFGEPHSFSAVFMFCLLLRSGVFLTGSSIRRRSTFSLRSGRINRFVGRRELLPAT